MIKDDVLSEPVHDKYWALKQMDEGRFVEMSNYNYNGSYFGQIKGSIRRFDKDGSQWCGISDILSTDQGERFELYEHVEYFDIKEAVDKISMNGKIMKCDDLFMNVTKGGNVVFYASNNMDGHIHVLQMLSDKWHEVQE